MEPMPRRVLPLVFAAAIFSPTMLSAGQTTPSTLSGDALALACAPRGSHEVPAARITVGGSLTNAEGVFAPWHRLVVNAGSEDGVKADADYYVRRVVPEREWHPKSEKPVYAIMTIGWVHIDELQSHKAIASIIHECDGIGPGDYLEPFSVPAVPTALPAGTPDYSQAGRVLFGVERATVGGSGSMFVIDRGSKQGLRPGQRVTIYRASNPGPNVIVARGTAMLVGEDITTIRVQDMRDAVMAGDSVAPHK
jgi:hypothetical protein